MSTETPPPNLEEARRRVVEELLRLEDDRDKCAETRARRARERRTAFRVVR